MENINLNKQRQDADAIFKASHIDSLFFTIVWISIMLLSLFEKSNDIMFFSKGVTTIGITGVFIYFFYLIFNFLKYIVFKKIIDLKTIASNKLFISFALFLQLLIYISFYYFNGFEKINIISGDAKNWLLISVGFICSIVAGLVKFLLELKDSTNDLSIKEINAITNAMKSSKNKVDFFR